MAWLTGRIVFDLRNVMFARLLQLPTHTYDNQSTGLLISKVTNDVNNVTGAATSVLTVAVRDSLTIVALMSWLLYLNWKLTLVALAITPLIAVVVRVFSKRLRSASRASLRAIGDITRFPHAQQLVGYAGLAGVAALRETSVIFAAIMSAFLLKERFRKRRYASVSLVTLGAVLLH